MRDRIDKRERTSWKRWRKREVAVFIWVYQQVTESD
jgi:hypothetical protein